jgi:hypothetical protein
MVNTRTHARTRVLQVIRKFFGDAMNKNMVLQTNRLAIATTESALRDRVAYFTFKITEQG